MKLETILEIIDRHIIDSREKLMTHDVEYKLRQVRSEIVTVAETLKEK